MQRTYYKQNLELTSATIECLADLFTFAADNRLSSSDDSSSYHIVQIKENASDVSIELVECAAYISRFAFAMCR